MKKILQRDSILLLCLLFCGTLFSQTDEEIEQQINAAFAQDSTEEVVVPVIPVITLNGAESDNYQDEGVFGLLTASRDIFVRITDFNLSAARFRQRGYDSENTMIYYNGVPMNDLESGWAGWSGWSGLNDMTRAQEIHPNLEAAGFSFGAVGGAINIDTRASSQRKQTRLTMTRSNNGNYNNRLMVSHATGMQENGWAFAASMSRRWAEEAYIPGTFFEGYSYFLSVDRQVTEKDLLNVQILGAPNTRGKAGASVQEMYDLAGTNYYNSYWGFQNGEKRNSRVARRNQPIMMLRWDHEFNDKVTLTTAANYQTGRNGSTALDWYRAPDPRPDYYRNLPSFLEESRVDERLRLESIYSNNIDSRQIDWDGFYEANRANIETINNVNGVEGNSVTGLRSRYMVLDRRYDSDKLNVNTNLTAILNDNLTFTGGLTYQHFTGHNFQTIEDLLGGDFSVDIDEFALRDFDISESDDLAQNDLNNPNRIVREGDVVGYNYDSNVRKGLAWAQGQYSKGGLGLFGAVELSTTSFWRTGLFQNGRFPDSSFGDSEKQNFFNYGLKGGVSYGIDGRNYIYANGAYQTRAPFFRDAFVSARTRNQVVPNLTSEEIISGEIAYVLRSPGAKVKIGAYYTQFNNQIEQRSFYHDVFRTFVNYTMTGVAKQHTGAEAAFEVKVPFISGLNVQGAASLGQFIYNERPSAVISLDNSAELVAEDKTVYIKNFYVPSRPQNTGTLGLEYRTSNYMTFNVNVNYFDGIWMDFNPDRRTIDGVQDVSVFSETVPENSELWDEILDQEQADDAFTVNVSIRKSFKLSNKLFMNLNFNVNNILNNTNFITNGFEQLRFDYATKDVDRFPTRYYYGRGITYFLNASFSFR